MKSIWKSIITDTITKFRNLVKQLALTFKSAKIGSELVNDIQTVINYKNSKLGKAGKIGIFQAIGFSERMKEAVSTQDEQKALDIMKLLTGTKKEILQQQFLNIAATVKWIGKLTKQLALTIAIKLAYFAIPAAIAVATAAAISFFTRTEDGFNRMSVSIASVKGGLAGFADSMAKVWESIESFRDGNLVLDFINDLGNGVLNMFKSIAEFGGSVIEKLTGVDRKSVV